MRVWAFDNEEHPLKKEVGPESFSHVGTFWGS